MRKICEICGLAEETDESETVDDIVSFARELIHICENCIQDRQQVT